MGIDAVKHVLALVFWVAAFVALAEISGSALYVWPALLISLWPHAVTHGMCFVLKARRPGLVLVGAMVAYAAWFFYVYLDATVWNPDPQSPIVFLFVGVMSLPVMIPLWLGAMVLEWKEKKKVGVGAQPAPPGR